MRKKRPIERQAGLVRDAILVVIASEDTYAVKQYFEFFHSTRIQFRVLSTTDGNSSPEHVLSRLKDYLAHYQIGKGDQLWLVCDTDHWIEPNHIATMRNVVARCRQRDIGVAISNPCFELWLLLHFTELSTGTMTCGEIGQQIRNAVGSYNKTEVSDLPLTLDRVAAAIRRAQANEPPADGIPGLMQTNVFRVIEDLVARKIVTLSD